VNFHDGRDNLATAPGRLLADASQAICKRLRSRVFGFGVAPEFMPKRDSARSARASWQRRGAF